MISLELFPGLITYFSGSCSPCLNLFFEMFEYLASASFLAYINLSCSFACSSKGFGIFLGGKYLGTLLTSGTFSGSSPSLISSCFPSASFF